MTYDEAKRTCHVRSAIYRTSQPETKYWKNHWIKLDERVPESDKTATDWEEYDPRDNDSSPMNVFND